MTEAMKKISSKQNVSEPLSINHVALKSKNIEQLAEFYQSILDLPLLKTFSDENGLRSIWLSLGNSIFMLERSDCDEDTTTTPADFFVDKPGYHLLALTVSVEQQSELKTRLSDSNITIEHESDYTIYFRDPDGNRLGLSSLDVRSITNSP